MGYKVTTAEDGDEAILLVREAAKNNHHFILAILDLTIPGGRGGKETVENLQDIDPHLKIIASSGYSEDPVMADPCEYGFAGRLIKPYRIDDLVPPPLRCEENQEFETDALRALLNCRIYVLEELLP
jgi:Response regulator containing CheY-like receiver, AAA-type ATPase, and DNA-binding domains